MRAVVQRVSTASVTVGDEVVGTVAGPALLAYVGVTHSDTTVQAERLADKVWGLRIFEGATPDDPERSAADVGAQVLVVSQFTLYADTSRGRRPSWSAAAPSAHAEPLVDAVVEALRRHGATVATGRFGAHMHVTATNDGPLALIVEV